MARNKRVIRAVRRFKAKRPVSRLDVAQGLLNKPIATLRRRSKRPLTKGEVDRMSQRIDEINEALDLCGDMDSDVVENLERELLHLEYTLETSLKNAR